MFKVDLKEFYDALCSCQAVSSAKDPSALIKTHDGVVDVCTSDGYRNFIKRIDTVMEVGAEDVAFIVNLGRTIPILSNYIPLDGFDADLLSVDLNGNVIEVACVIRYSEDKFDESLAGKVLNSMNNKIAVEGTTDPRHAMMCRPDYTKLLEAQEGSDVWNTSELKENISRLVIDKATKAVYMSGQRGIMFAIGSNQLNLVNIEKVANPFNVDVNTAKAICSIMSKFENEVNVNTTDGGRYVTLVNKDMKSAIWASCVMPNQGDISKLELYTKDAPYEDYRSVICKAGLTMTVNAVASSDKADSQLFQIVDVDTEPKIKLSNVVAGGSVSNEFETEIAAFEMKEGITEGVKGTVVVSTIKNILSDCKGTFVRLRIEVREGYDVIRISDIDTDGNELSVYFTMLNTKQ